MSMKEEMSEEVKEFITAFNALPEKTKNQIRIEMTKKTREIGQKTIDEIMEFLNPSLNN